MRSQSAGAPRGSSTSNPPGPRRFETLSEMLESRRRRGADAIAMEAPGRIPLTYGGLALQAEAVRHSLRRSGVGPSDRVAIVLPNGPEMAVAFLAVAAAGAVAPLNPAYRAEEFEAQLSRLGVKAVIVAAGADTPVRRVADARETLVLELTAGHGPAGSFTLSEAGGAEPSSGAAPGASDVALLLDTAGTTGTPKSVALTQSNLFAMARANENALGLGPKDRCLNVMPLFHSTGLVGVVLASIATGGSIVCAPGFYAPEFLGWVENFRPTWYTAVPSMHQAILARGQANDPPPPSGSLRFVRSSSSRLPSSTRGGLEALFRAPVIESFGLTETGMITCNPLPPALRKPGSVGVPCGVRIEVRSDGGGRAALGRSGEIVVSGAAVAHGYDRNPQATQDAFEGGWFRTGDEGYVDADGYLYLTGRLKEMINRGGEKISPWEIETALSEHPAVAEAAAFAVPHSSLSEEVGAAVVLRAAGSATERQLREFVAPRLADFKIPRWIRIVDEIPKNSLGKLQRTGLAGRLGISSAQQPAAPEREYVPPRTEEEAILAAIWRGVLRVDRVGILDDFFRLGGDSILATRILSQVRSAFNVELSTIALFEASTLEDMAAAIEAALSGDPDKATPALEPIRRR